MEFVESEGRHAFGGEFKDEAKTSTDCKQLCLATSGCAGVDFNSENNGCWFLDASNIDNLADAENINNYKLVENCDNITTPGKQVVVQVIYSHFVCKL